jgi:hypothetical protein
MNSLIDSEERYLRHLSFSALSQALDTKLNLDKARTQLHDELLQCIPSKLTFLIGISVF